MKLPDPLSADNWQTIGDRLWPPAKRPHLKRIETAWQQLQTGHHTQPHRPTGSLGADTETEASLLVRFHIYARRTFLIVRELSNHLSLGRFNHIRERGAGLCPALAALSPTSTSLYFEELYQQAYAPSVASLFAELGFPAPLASKPGQPLENGLEIFAASLFEYAAGSPSRAHRLVQQELERANDVLIIEPGDKPHAAFLQTLRDQLAANARLPVAPCPAQQICALNGNRQHWCHFRRVAEPTPLHRRLAQLTRTDPRSYNFSYLHYSAYRTPQQTPILLGKRPTKGKTTLLLCTTEGLEQRQVLARDPSHESLTALLPGRPFTGTS